MTWMHYLQPHQEVQGRELGDGHLLALRGESLARRQELLTRAWQRWDDILHGRIADRDALFERMCNPRIGDLVVEQTTSFRRGQKDQVQASGLLLVLERKEWASMDEEWARAVAEEKASHEASGLPFDAEQFAQERFTDTATYIQYGASAVDICRWSNCKFIAIPADLMEEAA